MLPFTIGVVYTINYGLLPKYLKRKKYLKLGLFIFILLATVPLIARICVMIISDNDLTIKNLADFNLLPFYFEIGLITFIALSIKLIKEGKIEREEKNLLEKEKIRVELFALKTQIDAHFLFNTLNNLYSLAIKKSDLVPKGILMLSEMLDFVLYETSHEIYSLNKELGFIENYIELEKLRYGERLKISIEKTIDCQETKITPMLLFPFVENSFKHGASKAIKNAWIKIKIHSALNQLVFEVENSKVSHEIKAKEISGGLGLENLRRRLNILYPGCHNLTISEDEERYSVSLIIAYNL
jgi:LytS/YehU family sensor histidine kinase